MQTGKVFFVYCIAATTGSVGVVIISMFFSKTGIERILSYFGENSLFIMVTHFYLSITVIAKMIIARIIPEDSFFYMFLSLLLVLLVELILVKLLGEKLRRYIKRFSDMICVYNEKNNY